MKNIPTKFLTIKNIFESIQLYCQMYCQNIQLKAESKKYEALHFRLNNHRIEFRSAKITPKKIGQFVTFWKRLGTGPIMPFDGADAIDFFMVSVEKDNYCGLFIFPQAVLAATGVISIDGKGGKRAMRIYPPWHATDSKQSQITQKWQLNYFYEVQIDGSIDSVMLSKFITIFG